MAPLSGVEEALYDCREINIEIAKVRAFQGHVLDGAQFNVQSVGGILGDWGIGNAIERNEADRSAAHRLNALYGLHAARSCSGNGSGTQVQMSQDPHDPAGTIDTGHVKLVPANTASGYCLLAPLGYRGTGSVGMPAVTSARPLCTSLGSD